MKKNFESNPPSVEATVQKPRELETSGAAPRLGTEKPQLQRMEKTKMEPGQTFSPHRQSLETQANPAKQPEDVDKRPDIPDNDKIMGVDEGASSDYYRFRSEEERYRRIEKKNADRAKSLKSDISNGRIPAEKLSAAKREMEDCQRKAREARNRADDFHKKAKRALASAQHASPEFNVDADDIQTASVEVCRRSRTPQYYPL